LSKKLRAEQRRAAAVAVFCISLIRGCKLRLAHQIEKQAKDDDDDELLRGQYRLDSAGADTCTFTIILRSEDKPFTAISYLKWGTIGAVAGFASSHCLPQRLAMLFLFACRRRSSRQLPCTGACRDSIGEA
jgi:hypothetical protein